MGCCSGKPDKKRSTRKSHYEPGNDSEKALHELLETERGFALDLECLMKNYLDPLCEKGFFENTELSLFHSVCLDLVQVQEKFQKKIEFHMVDIHNPLVDLADIIYNVGEDFIEIERDFSVFSKYVVAMSHVQSVITKGSKGYDENISQFLDKQASQLKTDEENQKIMTMESLILKPFQRAMLYPLFLDRLEKQSEEDTCDKEQIVDAIESIKKVCTHMNNALKRDQKNKDEYKGLLKHYGISDKK